MNEFDVQITNRTSEPATIAVETTADGTQVVVGTFTVRDETTVVIGTVPADAQRVLVNVRMVTVGGQESISESPDVTARSQTETFALGEQPNPLEALEIQLQAPGVLRVHPLYYETPY